MPGFGDPYEKLPHQWVQGCQAFVALEKTEAYSLGLNRGRPMMNHSCSPWL